MSGDSKACAAAFLTGSSLAMTVYVYASIARAAFSDPDSVTMLLFIAMTGGALGLAVYHRRQKGGR